MAAHTAGLFRSVRWAKGGVEYEEQSSTGELTYITAGFVNIFLSGLKICFLPHELDMAAASLNVLPCFCNGFLQSTVLYIFVAIKPVENITFDNASNSLISPTVENTAIYSVFFNFSMFQCR